MKKEHLVIGICAHVDAGKTTLSEGLLYLGGSIRKIGRVDDRDAFLDTDEMERARGITIFSKQAQFTSQSAEGNERTYMLLDTPGHADFSPEMERTLQVLDLAVLVISAADGVNAQVRTLWKLLEHYNVPVMIFVNKMDQMESIGLYSEKREELMGEIREKLSGNALEFAAPGDADGYNAASGDSTTGKGTSADEAASAATVFAERILDDDALCEALALCNEALLNKFLEGEPLTNIDVRHLIAGRNVFPVFFGAALRMAQKDKQNESGVPELLLGLDAFAPVRAYPEEFGARVFKITRDGRERLTWMKITGGELSVRQVLSYAGRSYEAASDDETDDGMTQDKITQIRFYSGEKFTPLQTAEAGVVCAARIPLRHIEICAFSRRKSRSCWSATTSERRRSPRSSWAKSSGRFSRISACSGSAWKSCSAGRLSFTRRRSRPRWRVSATLSRSAIMRKCTFCSSRASRAAALFSIQSVLSTRWLRIGSG